MKILITGGAGFIGSAVVRHAITAGHSVVNLDALTYAASPDTVASASDNQVFQQTFDIGKKLGLLDVVPSMRTHWNSLQESVKSYASSRELVFHDRAGVRWDWTCSAFVLPPVLV